MNALIVFLNGEEIVFIDIRKLTEKQIKRLKSFHNKFLNSSDLSEKMFDRLNKFFFDRKGKLKHPHTQEMIVNAWYDIVIHTGCLP